MIPEGFDKAVDYHISLIPGVNTDYPLNAELRAGELLRFSAQLLRLRTMTISEKIASNCIGVAVYHEIYQNTLFPDKIGVNEKKATVEANPRYLDAMSKVEFCEGEIKYLSGLLDLFNNGHLLLRQMAKGLTV